MTPKPRKAHNKTPEQMAEIIREAARHGDACFHFWKKYGRLATKDDDLTEFLVDRNTLNE